ncbi:MAG TPA: GNAT family N-acetyltransferase [Vicinamibacterales bacterium]
MTIRPATVGDAATLSELARRTFYDTFAPTNNAGDMSLYLAGAYGVDQQTRELNDRDITTLLVEEDGQAIAYAQLRAGHVPDCVAGADPIELWRFYVVQGRHGRGIAQSLMERVRAEARAIGAKTLWLGVWERNDRARAFYVKSGFTVAGDHIFLFGTDPQTDLVMVAPL